MTEEEKFEQNQYDEDERRRMGIVIDVSVALWTSLMTVSGILLGVFVAVPNIWQNLPLVVSIAFVASSILSLGLLIDNLRVVRNLYVRLGQVQPPQPLTGERIEEDRKRTKSGFKNRYRNEKIVWVCLLFEVLALLAAIILNRYMNCG